MSGEVLGKRLGSGSLGEGLKKRAPLSKEMGRLGGSLLLGSLLVAGHGVALAEAQLEVGTSTTLPPSRLRRCCHPHRWECDKLERIPILSKPPICPFP